MPSDRLVRFPGTCWQEIEALPQPLRWTVQRAIFHLLDEPTFPQSRGFPSAVTTAFGALLGGTTKIQPGQVLFLAPG